MGPGPLHLPGGAHHDYLGGVLDGSPTVVSWGANRLDMFVTSNNTYAYHKVWDGSGWWPSMTDYEFHGGAIVQ